MVLNYDNYCLKMNYKIKLKFNGMLSSKDTSITHRQHNYIRNNPLSPSTDRYST